MRDRDEEMNSPLKGLVLSHDSMRGYIRTDCLYKAIANLMGIVHLCYRNGIVGREMIYSLQLARRGVTLLAL